VSGSGRAALRAIEDTATDFETVMRRLINARLLTVDGDPDHDDVYVDLSHEVMISAWPTLARWIQIWRVDEQRRRQIETAAAAWRTRGKGAGGLLDAIELAELAAWRATETARELGQSAEVAAFVAASEAAVREATIHLARRSVATAAAATAGIKRPGCRTRSILHRSFPRWRAGNVGGRQGERLVIAELHEVAVVADRVGGIGSDAPMDPLQFAAAFESSESRQ
jgi:hypothetical protein